MCLLLADILLAGVRHYRSFRANQHNLVVDMKNHDGSHTLTFYRQEMNWGRVRYRAMYREEEKLMCPL